MSCLYLGSKCLALCMFLNLFFQLGDGSIPLFLHLEASSLEGGHLSNSFSGLYSCSLSALEIGLNLTLITLSLNLLDRKSIRLNSSHSQQSRMPSSA